MYRKKVEDAPLLVTFSDLYLRPGRTSANPEDILLNSRLTNNITVNLPLVSSPMDTVTGAEMAISLARLGGIGIVHRNCSLEEEVAMVSKVKQAAVNNPLASVDDQERLRVGAAIGPYDIDRAKALDEFTDVILIDLAHGHNMNAMRSAAKIADIIESELIYGSLGSVEATEDVLTTIDNVGALRVGIGSGAICSTSSVTGASSPTLYSTIQVASSLKEMKSSIPVIADGGIGNPGHAALCFAAGASTVMLGRLFAATTQAPGKLVKIKGDMMKEYRGMGSDAAKSVRHALDRYSKPSKSIAEGISGYIPHVGELDKMVASFTSGLSASFGYAGAANVPEMWELAKFGWISSQGVSETRPHDITI